MPESSDNVLIAGNDFTDEASVLDLLDHVLNAGVVVRGSLVISLAGVDLVYVGLDVILTSIETALKYLRVEPARPHFSLPNRNKSTE